MIRRQYLTVHNFWDLIEHCHENIRQAILRRGGCVGTEHRSSLRRPNHGSVRGDRKVDERRIASGTAAPQCGSYDDKSDSCHERVGATGWSPLPFGALHQRTQGPHWGAALPGGLPGGDSSPSFENEIIFYKTIKAHYPTQRQPKDQDND
jgi:hypothetical protein